MKNIGILIFNDVELLDFAGPYEVFSITNEINDDSLCKTFSVSELPGKIKTVNGLEVIPEYSFNDCPCTDVVIIPGGIGTKVLTANETVISWILDRYDKSYMVFSVCSGARLLAKAGLLSSLKFITHHDVILDILEIDPTARPQEGKRYVDEGKILTSAGISAGMDLSLYVVSKLFGKERADKTAHYMEYKKQN